MVRYVGGGKNTVESCRSIDVLRWHKLVACARPGSTKRHKGAGLIHGYFGMGEASEAARLEAQRARADFKAMLERGA